MSHYFRQLLTSSGLASRSSTPVPSQSVEAPRAPAAFSEISEESIALPAHSPAGVSLQNRSQPPIASFLQSRSPDGVMLEMPKHKGASTALSAGIVVISQTRSAASQPAITVGAQPSAAVSTTTNPSRAASDETSAPTPTLEELIQHVFRWVGENPANVTPPALNQLSKQDEPFTKTKSILSSSARSATATTAPSISTTPTVVPAPAVEAASAHESSVEISIGTLQIQVEAPSNAAPKPVRRPVAPRSATPAPVAQRPAIDINRLRRGFYL